MERIFGGTVPLSLFLRNKNRRNSTLTGSSGGASVQSGWENVRPVHPPGEPP